MLQKKTKSKKCKQTAYCNETAYVSTIMLKLIQLRPTLSSILILTVVIDNRVL